VAKKKAKNRKRGERKSPQVGVISVNGARRVGDSTASHRSHRGFGKKPSEPNPDPRTSFVTGEWVEIPSKIIGPPS
jgi:hypothetical protein